MSTTMIKRLQEDVAAYLASDEQLHFVQVIREAPADAQGGLIFEQFVNEALAGQVPVNGKAGLCVIVFTPEGKPESIQNRGLACELELTIRVIENPAVNDDPIHGTGIKAEEMLEVIMMLLQNWQPLKGHPLTLVEFYKVPIKDVTPLWAWECVFRARDARQARAKVATPQITLSESLVTLTCATEGAQIFFTIDGTLPGLNASIYTAPLDVDGVTVRAIARLCGMAASDVAEVEV